MQTLNFTIQAKKVGAGHYLVTVIDNDNDVKKSYTETDMQIIDVLSEQEEMYDITLEQATEHVIKKAGF